MSFAKRVFCEICLYSSQRLLIMNEGTCMEWYASETHICQGIKKCVFEIEMIHLLCTLFRICKLLDSFGRGRRRKKL